MKLGRILVGMSLVGLSGSGVIAHDGDHTVQEKLGYPAEAKLLVIHADDLGMGHSKNVATLRAMEEGIVTSASVMMPTPWVSEVLDYAQENPQVDLGVHLTLTAEWKHYKWGPMAGKDQVPSLVTPEGYFHESVPAFAAAAKTDEVEREVRTQIDHAIALGFDMTHLDAHMGALGATDALLAMYLRVGAEYQLPIRMHSHAGEGVENAELKAALAEYPANFQVIEGAPPESYPDGMAAYYNQVLRDLKPGLNLLVLHLAFDDEETNAITAEHPLWGAKWRQIDYDWAMSAEARRIIEEEGIILIDSRLLRDRLIREGP
jgi:predicted glycoside hydrolase/deacetylase ChbG (UPF0249 family)